MIIIVSILGLIMAAGFTWACLVMRNEAKDYAELDARYEKTLSLLADLHDHCEHCCGPDVIWNGWCWDHNPDLRTQVKEFLAEEGLG